MIYEPRPEDIRQVPPEYDERVRDALQNFSLEELAELSEVTGTTMNSGYLMSLGNKASREDYIEELSEVGDKAGWQLERLYKALDIKK